MAKKAEIKEEEFDINDIIESECLFTKEDFLFLVKCLNEDYLNIKKKMEEIENIYNSLEDEARKRWYFEYKPCALTIAARNNRTLPF